jgi:ribosomal protein S18 acetylase RimI-like enzyme
MTQSTVHIRAVQQNEIAGLRAISISTFLEAFASSNTDEDIAVYLEENMSEAKLAAELDTEGSAFYFICADGRTAGYLKVNVGAAQTEPQPDTYLEIERIYVAKEYQGLQLGRRLMEKALELAAGQGKTYVWLGVWEHNLNAIQFYRKFGFEIFDRHIFRLGSDEQTDVLMKVALN